MDHYGYSTRPLVEYNFDLFTDRASFLGWLGHMTERRRLAIILDPAASDPAKTKNKRVQVTIDLEREESEPEIVPSGLPFLLKLSLPSLLKRKLKKNILPKKIKTKERKFLTLKGRNTSLPRNLRDLPPRVAHSEAPLGLGPLASN